MVGTLILVDPVSRTIMALQTNGVHDNNKPKVDIIDTYPDNVELIAAPGPERGRLRGSALPQLRQR